MSLTRRALVTRGIAGAGSLAVPGSLVAAATAHAQAESDAQTDALERLITLEQAAELSYSIAAEEAMLDAEVTSLFEELSIHAEDRAAAFSEAMDQLLVDPPEADSDPDDYEVLKDDFDPDADEKDLLAFFIDLESQIIEAYEEAQADLEEPDLVRSAAQVGASHAQALVALRLAAQEKGPLTELPARSSSATDTDEEDSDS